MSKIKDHEHDMKDLEQEEEIFPNPDEALIYATWCCFDYDCDYHELRLVRIE